MQVLEANPFALLSGGLDELQSDFVLSTAHGELMEALSADDRLCKLLELTAGIRSGRYDEEDRLQRRGFVLVDAAECKWSRLHLLASEGLLYEELHRRLKSIWPQYFHDDASLEGADSRESKRRKLLLWLGALHERRPCSLIVELELGHEGRERTSKVRKGLVPILREPPWRSNLSACAKNLPCEELPLILAEEVGVDALHKMEAVREPVALEERSTDFGEAELDEAVR